MIFLGLAEGSIELVPNGTLFFHMAIILAMVALLNATLFKPINTILAGRERRTRGRSDEAHKTLRRVDAGITRYEQSLREARAEGYRLMEQVRGEAMSARQEKLNATRAEIERLLVEEKAAISAQTETARAELESDARRMAREISSRILSRPLSDQPATGARL